MALDPRVQLGLVRATLASAQLLTKFKAQCPRRRDGIPLAGLVRQLRELAAAVGVPFTLGAACRRLAADGAR